MGNNYKHDEPVPLATHPTSTSHSGEPNRPTLCPGGFGTNDRFTDAFDKEDVIPHPSTFPTRSPVHVVLGNFFLAIFLISSIVLIAFFTVAWFTVLQDAQSVNEWATSNVTGVSLCSHHSE